MSRFLDCSLSSCRFASTVAVASSSLCGARRKGEKGRNCTLKTLHSHHLTRTLEERPHVAPATTHSGPEKQLEERATEIGYITYPMPIHTVPCWFSSICTRPHPPTPPHTNPCHPSLTPCPSIPPHTHPRHSTPIHATPHWPTSICITPHQPTPTLTGPHSSVSPYTSLCHPTGLRKADWLSLLYYAHVPQLNRL